MNRDVKRLLDNALAPATKSSYSNALKHYKRFHTSFYLGTPLLPVSSVKLAQFIAYCNAQSLKPTTITSYVSAISYVHKINALPNPVDAFAIRKILYGLRKASPPDKRKPFDIPLLRALVRTLKVVCPDCFNYAVFKAMFLVAFFGLFRAGELALSPSGVANVMLKQFTSFKFNNNSPVAVSIQLQTFKHSSGRKISIPISNQPDRELCPVTALYQLCLKQFHATGPLFRLNNGCPVSTTTFRAVLRKCVQYMNLDPSLYTTHSFRIGGATLAHQQNMSDTELQRLGRWKSSAFKKYLRPQPLR